jgi:hypothetical protein
MFELPLRTISVFTRDGKHEFARSTMTTGGGYVKVVTDYNARGDSAKEVWFPVGEIKRIVFGAEEEK